MQWSVEPERPLAQDFLSELGLLGVSARLKRLNDTLTASIKELYGANGVDIEPSWHLVLLFLKERSATITEVSTAMRLSQPATTMMVRRMADRGYLDVRADEDDSRKRIIRLSTKARRRMPKFERIWAAGQAAMGAILKGNMAFIGHLESFEARVGERSFAARALERLERG